MGLDLTMISPEARMAFIKSGERFGSEDTLDQANLTLNAYATHGSKLGDYGFTPDDATELQNVRDALIVAGVGREAKRTQKKIDTVAHTAAMRDAHGIRLRARSVLNAAERGLLLAGQTESIQKIDTLLTRDSAAGEDAEALAKQLDALQGILKDPVIAGAAQTRGGPKVVLDLDRHAKALRDAAKAKAEPRGTPLETKHLDLLDGMVVSLVRMARDSADAAARELSEPAMATAFELSGLYKRHAKKKKADEVVPAIEPDGATGG